MPRPQIDFVPWDPESPEHVERLYDQRVQCGWSQELVQSWRDDQRAGTKCFYWIVLVSDDAEYLSERLDKLAAKFPKEATPLIDTATSIRAVARTPSGAPLHPVGHIGLGVSHPQALGHGFDIPTEDTMWIKSLYISYALQAEGIGGAAVDRIEGMAAAAPLNAKHLVIDTTHEDDQMNPEMNAAFHEKMPKLSNQQWYTRRGYKFLGVIKDFYDDVDRTGKVWKIAAVVMVKDLQ